MEKKSLVNVKSLTNLYANENGFWGEGCYLYATASYLKIVKKEDRGSSFNQPKTAYRLVL